MLISNESLNRYVVFDLTAEEFGTPSTYKTDNVGIVQRIRLFMVKDDKSFYVE